MGRVTAVAGRYLPQELESQHHPFAGVGHVETSCRGLAVPAVKMAAVAGLPSVSKVAETRAA